MAEPLLENLRAFAAKVAGALGGTAVDQAELTGFLSSDFDPFLSHLFAYGKVTPRSAAKALKGLPGFVWLAEEPAPGSLDVPEEHRLLFGLMQEMTSTTAAPTVTGQVDYEGGLHPWSQRCCWSVVSSADRRLWWWGESVSRVGGG
jgi:hypothetical protein